MLPLHAQAQWRLPISIAIGSIRLSESSIIPWPRRRFLLQHQFVLTLALRLHAHALHVSGGQACLDGLLAQQLDGLSHVRQFAILALGRRSQLLQSIRHVGQRLLKGRNHMGLQERRR